MKMSAAGRPLIRSGVFEFDLATGELRKSGVHIHLPPQPGKILTLLTAHPGELVTREEIRQQVWGKETFVDFEQGLNHCIKQIRTALGDDAEHSRYIETLPRQGYRFIAPVETVVPPGGAVREPPLRRRWVVALASAIVVVGLAALFALNVAGLRERVLRAVGAVREPPLQIQSIAVLPLENLSHDPEQEYFADGMTEELITTLGKISALRVISRTTAMHFKGTKKTLPEIARELNVDAVVEGTVLRSGNRVRVTANLLHAPTDRHLWANSYEGEMQDVLVLQGEVARAIADEIRIKLTPQQRARLASTRLVNPEAHEAYLKGRYYWNLRTEGALNKSLGYFQQAIEKDPDFALAYAGLADTYILLGGFELVRPEEAFPRVKTAAFKALEIDETLVEAHVPLGNARMHYDWDWAGAEKELKRAIELNPNYEVAHRSYAVYLTFMGRHNEAIAEAKRAHELDPVSIVTNSLESWVLLFARRYDEAIAQGKRTLELNPGFYLAHSQLGWAYEQKKLYEQAISEYKEVIALEAGSPTLTADLAHGYASAGKRTEALAVVAHLKELSKQRYVSPYQMAAIYAALGDTDQAFAWLEEAYKKRAASLDALKVDPGIDSLRPDPRFQDLLRRMNFPP